MGIRSTMTSNPLNIKIFIRNGSQRIPYRLGLKFGSGSTWV